MIRIDRQYITNPLTRPALRSAKSAQYIIPKVNWIVAHWTANQKKGADAKANRNYFNNGAPGPNGSHREASAHYCVDDHSVIQCLPENEVGFHIGGTRYTDLGKRMRPRPGLSPNYAGAVGFEMCVNSDGDFEKTQANSITLAAMLLLKYGLSTNQLIRHYDVTGKDCPKMLLNNTAWAAFKAKVNSAINILILQGFRAATVTADELNVRDGIGTTSKVLYALKKGEVVLASTDTQKNAGWVEVGDNQWSNSKFLSFGF